MQTFGSLYVLNISEIENRLTAEFNWTLKGSPKFNLRKTDLNTTFLSFKDLKFEIKGT